MKSIIKITKKKEKMKTEDKSNVPRVRIAVLGNVNVGKSGKNNTFFVKIF